MDNRPNTASGQPSNNTNMGTMTMAPRPATSGMGSSISLPPLMEILGDYYRSSHNDSSRFMPRRFAERESPILGLRTPSRPAISSIASVLDPSSSSPPSSKRRKVVYSPPRRPLSLTRPSLKRAVSDAPEKDGVQATVGYTGYTPVYPPEDIDRRRLSNISSTSHPETSSLPPVSAITNTRGSSSESERPSIPSLTSLFSPTQPPTPHTSGSRHPYEADYQPPQSNPPPFYRHSGDQQPPYLPPSPNSHTHYSSHASPRHAPLLTQAYPAPRGVAYMPRPSQPVSTHDRSPFTPPMPSMPSMHRGLESFDQVARLGTKRRRGNLPRHVTDTLRSWLTNHVAHPYPTEEEKQQLCQITGLNMNQISNWFINARRRKLPQQRTDAEPHLLAQPTTSPPRPTASLGHTRSHSHDTTGILPPPLPPPQQQGPYTSSGR